MQSQQTGTLQGSGCSFLGGGWLAVSCRKSEEGRGRHPAPNHRYHKSEKVGSPMNHVYTPVSKTYKSVVSKTMPYWISGSGQWEELDGDRGPFQASMFPRESGGRPDGCMLQDIDGGGPLYGALVTGPSTGQGCPACNHGISLAT